MSILAGGLGLKRLWGLGKRQDTAKTDTAADSGATTGGSGSLEPAIVWQAANPMEAQIVKGRLLSEGIPAIVRGESMGKIYGFTFGSLAERDVLVPGPLAEMAQRILSEEVDSAEILWEVEEETGK